MEEIVKEYIIIPDLVTGLILAGIIALISFLFKNKIWRTIYNTKIQNKEKDEEDLTGEKIKIRQSKNYGMYKDWKRRTFFSLNKKDLNDFDYIKFEIKETNISLYIATKELKKNINDYDKKGNAKIYINQKKDGKFFITRLGNTAINYEFKLEQIPTEPPSFYALKKTKD